MTDHMTCKGNMFLYPPPSLAPAIYVFPLVGNEMKISQELSDLSAAAMSLGLQSAKQPPIYIICTVFYRSPQHFSKSPGSSPWYCGHDGFQVPKTKTN